MQVKVALIFFRLVQYNSTQILNQIKSQNHVFILLPFVLLGKPFTAMISSWSKRCPLKSFHQRISFWMTIWKGFFFFVKMSFTDVLSWFCKVPQEQISSHQYKITVGIFSINHGRYVIVFKKNPFNFRPFG